jgi:hypothetical protein
MEKFTLTRSQYQEIYNWYMKNDADSFINWNEWKIRDLAEWAGRNSKSMDEKDYWVLKFGCGNPAKFNKNDLGRLSEYLWDMISEELI